MRARHVQAGILAADKVLTVSPNYASEISANAEKGVELDKYIRWVCAHVNDFGAGSSSMCGTDHVQA